MKQHYVVGFAFFENNVLLINKLKPEWQKGLLNGVGGKVEKNEWPPVAMVREFGEETGVTIPQEDWRLIATLSGNDFLVNFYACHEIVELFFVQQTEAEKPEWFDINNLPSNIIPNLKWLIPLAQDKEVFAQCTDDILPGEGTGDN